jgi:deoxycytidine triphosphate deaminase
VAPTLAEALFVAIKHRLDDLKSLLDALTGRLAGSAEATRKALELFDTYCAVLGRRVALDWKQFEDDDETRTSLLRLYLRDIGARLEELEEWFAGGADASVPPALVDAVAAECRATLSSDRHVILALGDPDNMATLVDELPELVFQSTQSLLDDEGIALPVDKFALIQISRFEANNPIWRPLIIGHEIGHLALLESSLLDEFHIADSLDSVRVTGLRRMPDHYENLRGFPVLAMETAAEDWLEELICDAYAVRRWGPAAVAALGSYFEQVGAVNGYGIHPPGWFRVRLMLDWLGAASESTFAQLLQPWKELAHGDHEASDDWAEYLIEIFTAAAPEITPLLDAWPARYDFEAAADRISGIADALHSGVPRVEVQIGGTLELASDADIVNAAWLERSREHPRALYRLVEKALESVDFLRRWQRAGGVVDPALGDIVTEANVGNQGLLTEAAIIQRCITQDEKQLLIVTPLLPGAIKDAGIDLRLGRHFIVFQRASTGAFDALIDDDDPRTMQRIVERRWGEGFVLHPGELVLAATLEYVVLPGDLGAQVITRSSYGRLGLITATAIQIHPLFRGCLTLELVNLGALPISLYPGERVAQLVLSVATPPLIGTLEPKYDCATRPEFSRVRKDRDAGILRHLGDL